MDVRYKFHPLLYRALLYMAIRSSSKTISTTKVFDEVGKFFSQLTSNSRGYLNSSVARLVITMNKQYKATKMRQAVSINIRVGYTW